MGFGTVCYKPAMRRSFHKKKHDKSSKAFRTYIGLLLIQGIPERRFQLQISEIQCIVNGCWLVLTSIEKQRQYYAISQFILFQTFRPHCGLLQGTYTMFFSYLKPVRFIKQYNSRNEKFKA